jgi:hypothetical protein
MRKSTDGDCKNHMRTRPFAAKKEKENDTYKKNGQILVPSSNRVDSGIDI